MKRYKVREDLLPATKKLAIGTILKRSGLFKKDDKMRAYLKNGHVKAKGKTMKRAGQTIKIDRNNIKVKVKGWGKAIIKLEPENVED